MSKGNSLRTSLAFQPNIDRLSGVVPAHRMSLAAAATAWLPANLLAVGFGMPVYSQSLPISQQMAATLPINRYASVMETSSKDQVSPEKAMLWLRQLFTDAGRGKFGGTGIAVENKVQVTPNYETNKTDIVSLDNLNKWNIELTGINKSHRHSRPQGLPQAPIDVGVSRTRWRFRSDHRPRPQPGTENEGGTTVS